MYSSRIVGGGAHICLPLSLGLGFRVSELVGCWFRDLEV